VWRAETRRSRKLYTRAIAQVGKYPVDRRKLSESLVVSRREPS